MDDGYRASPNRDEEFVMSFQPGDVVFLKSGGQSLTVAAVDDDTIECVWLGEEGELFREALPSVVLTKAQEVDDIEDDADDEAGDEDAEHETDDEAEEKPKRKIA